MNAPHNPVSWKQQRSLVFAWLLLFFPVGLYALWSGDLVDRKRKWMITGAVAAVLVVATSTFLSLVYALILVPLALWILWRDPEISRAMFNRFAIGGALAALLTLFSLPGQTGQENTPDDDSCAAVRTSGNCTYYRDDQCNVIAQSCQ